MTALRAIAARTALMAFSAVLSVGAGELALRVVYRDAGRSTLGGPGGMKFAHETIRGSNRARLDVGPKTAGVPRVMVIGDSITYGVGVREWRATWPERVAVALEQEGRRHEFAVFAVPGNDIPQHLEMMRAWGDAVQPDVVIYQWYVNDIEAISHRPTVEAPWQRHAWHQPLRAWSYLYYLLDHRLSHWASDPLHNYVSYLRSEFAPGTMEWAEFERQFHGFALLARSASRRILMLYPQVPFRGLYPLQTLHERMRVAAGPHALEIPPMAWTRTGALVAWEGAPRGQAVVMAGGRGIPGVQTSEYLFAPGRLDVSFAIVAHSPGFDLGHVTLVDASTGSILASEPLTRSDAAPISELAVNFSVPGDRLRQLRFEVFANGREQWGLANITIPVNYGFEVIDLTEPLNTFNTHTSSFDAHPNERAHRVMADAVFTALTSAADQR